ncbi:MAG: hypothetical protein ACO2ZE_11860, partial [Pseudohongiellaceae bacterium]
MREEYDVASLETTANDLMSERDAILNETRQRSRDQSGQGLTKSVVAGRVGEIERQANERLSVINQTLDSV